MTATVSRSGATSAPSMQTSFDELGTPLRDVTFVVFDLETTGGQVKAEGITEIGAVKVRGGEVVGEFATLVDPGRPIPVAITQLTGITTAMVTAAPRIASVLPQFLEFIAPTDVLVAHNARFDMGFLKAACRGLELPVPRNDVVDTVRLARALVSKDEVRNYRLGSLAAHFGASTTPNHRALADARATVDVLHALLGRLGGLGVTTREDLLGFAPHVPARRRKKSSLADGLPHGPGVYLFRDERGEVLYVGTSLNVHERVRSYFTASEKRRRMGAMVDRAARADAVPCATALEAHVREIRLIAEYKPPYNRRSKSPERAVWIKITNEPFPRLSIVRQISRDESAIGPFRSVRSAHAAKEAIYAVRKIRQCTQRLGKKPSKQACALAELGRCDAPCTGAISPERYRAEVVQALVDELNAQTPSLVADLSRRLRSLSDQQRYEEARTLRDGISELVAGLDRHQRANPLQQNPCFIAARPRPRGGWEFIHTTFGRLASSSVASPSQDPRVVIAAMEATADVRSDCPPTHPDETRAILRWLESEGTRVVRSDQPWVMPITGARLPARQFIPLARNAREHAPTRLTSH